MNNENGIVHIKKNDKPQTIQNSGSFESLIIGGLLKIVIKYTTQGINNNDAWKLKMDCRVANVKKPY
jgi:hypothetical protein